MMIVRFLIVRGSNGKKVDYGLSHRDAGGGDHSSLVHHLEVPQMTNTEEKLLELGNNLARALGHRLAYPCPKVSPAVPCTCGAGAQQAKALEDWAHLLDQIKES
jgi:hypothetical protein